MTYTELKDYLQNKCDELTEELKTEDEKLKYFEEFLRENKLSSINELSNVDIKKFFVTYILANTENYSIEELEDMFEGNRNEILNTDSEEIVDYLIMIAKFSENNLIRELIKTLNNPNEKNHTKSLRSIFNPRKFLDDILVDFLANNTDEIKDKLSIIDLYIKEEDLVMDTFKLIRLFKEVREIQEDFEERKIEFEAENDIHIRKRDSKEMLNDLIGDAYNDNKKDIFKELQKIKDYYARKTQIKRSEDRSNRKLLGIYQNLITNLDNALKKDEIIDYNQLIYKIPDEKIRLEVLKIVYLHNIKGYKELEEKYETLEKNSVTKYKALLNEKGITEEEYNLEEVMKNSFEDLNDILTMLKKMDITEKEVIIQIIQTTTKERVLEIKELFDKNLISSRFITANPKLFLKEDSSYETILENIKILQDKKINVLSFRNNLETLFLEPIQFKKNLEVLEEYGILNKLSKDISFKFIFNSNLSKLIDMILELGYEDYLVSDLSLLNYDITSWKRLQILKTLNIPIDTKEELIEVLSTTTFMVPDDKLDNYIYNVTALVENKELNAKEETSKKIIEELNQSNNLTARTIKINDVILSRNRITRNLKEFKDDTIKIEELIKVITKDSILSEEEYEKIVNVVYKKLTK